MTIKFNAQKMAAITNAKISFTGMQPQINFSIQDDNIFAGVDNGFMKIIGMIKIDSVVNQKVQFSLPYDMVNEIFAKFGKKDIFLEYKEKYITIRDEKFKFNLLPLISEYNSIMEIVDGFETICAMDFPVAIFKDVMSKSTICTAKDKLKPILCGVNVSFFEEGKMNIVALDGKRLVNAVIDDLSAFAITGDVKSNPLNLDVGAIRKVIDESETPIKISWNNQAVMYQYNNIKFLSPLVEGKFPDYKRIIPTEYKYTTIINKHEMVDAIKHVSIVTKGSIMTAMATHRVNCEFKPDGIRVYSAADSGDSDTIMGYAGDIQKHTLAFNADYLELILSNVDDAQFTMQMTDDKTPVKITPKCEKPTYFYLFMPLVLDS